MSSIYYGSQAGETADTGPVMPWTATDCYEVAHVHAANQPCECPCHDRERDGDEDLYVNGEIGDQA